MIKIALHLVSLCWASPTYNTSERGMWKPPNQPEGREPREGSENTPQMRGTFSSFLYLPFSALLLLQLRKHNLFDTWLKRHCTPSLTNWWNPKLSLGAGSFIWLLQMFKPRRKYTCVCQRLAKCAPDWQNTESFKKGGNCTASTAIW